MEKKKCATVKDFAIVLSEQYKSHFPDSVVEVVRTDAGGWMWIADGVQMQEFLLIGEKFIMRFHGENGCDFVVDLPKRKDS